MAQHVKIIEVGPRDGLQNIKTIWSVSKRYQLIKKLAAAGIRNIEAGAFVSPQWIPQMKESDRLIKQILRQQQSKHIARDVIFSALVPNMKGLETAIASGIKRIAIFGACSESFSQHNINCSINESFMRFQEVISCAKQRKMSIRGYLSTAFGCPYEGNVSLARVITLTQKMLAMGVDEVSIGDTIGMGTPKQVEQLINRMKNKKVPLKRIAMHFHNTYGMALANVLMSYQLGIRTFDSSINGLGGCPYAKSAKGNVATEDLVFMFNGMGVNTGIDITKLPQIT